ncbi:hypothetical protein [Dyadobacter sp. 676]|uniref:Cytochrome c domain-containing protein n=1 Tax=Dyadobacter sp. 676 TaxID=3088362 RepID=A0AAU8FNV9_9BACT
MKIAYLAASAAVWSVCAFTKQPEAPRQLVRNSPVSAAMYQKVVSKDDAVKRGEYLVTIMGCADCHAPKKMTPPGAGTGYGPFPVGLQ